MKSLMETLVNVSNALTHLDPEAEHHDAVALDEAFETVRTMQGSLVGFMTYIEDGNVIELRPCGFIAELRQTIDLIEGKLG